MSAALRSFMPDPEVLRQKVKSGTAKRMMRFAAPYSGLLGIFLLITILDSGVWILTPLVYRTIIDQGLLEGDAHLIIRFAVLAAGLGALSNGLTLVQTYLSATIGARVVLKLRTDLYDHVQRMALDFFTRVQTGALVNRLNTDVIGAQTAFTDILSTVVGNGIAFISVLIAMFLLSKPMATAAILLCPLFIIPARFWGRKLQAMIRESFDLSAGMTSLMTERFNVGGAMVGKLFGRPRDESKEFETKAARVSAVGVKTSIYGRLFFTALGLMTVFATAFTYGWGGVLAVQHRLDIGAVIAFVSYLTRLYNVSMGLSNSQVSLMTALVSFERVFDVLDLKPLLQESLVAADIPGGPALISFDHVTFSYPHPTDMSLASLEPANISEDRPAKKVLQDVSFVVGPGQLVALVGTSGAGKTTTTYLISRLYDVQSGSVAINGIDVREAKLESLRQRVGVVTQDTYLFHDTIRANLSYAKPKATERELEDALAGAQLLPFVRSLPNGIDTVVGERGYRFSGGEKQRLAIARLLLKAPDIVILDEATSHLDSESEVAVQKAFEVALRGRTSVVVAHRLSTILRANQILVFSQGKIVERGTHLELLQKQGLYKELFDLQFSRPNSVVDSAYASAAGQALHAPRTID